MMMTFSNFPFQLYKSLILCVLLNWTYDVNDNVDRSRELLCCPKPNFFIVIMIPSLWDFEEEYI